MYRYLCVLQARTVLNSGDRPDMYRNINKKITRNKTACPLHHFIVRCLCSSCCLRYFVCVVPENCKFMLYHNITGILAANTIDC